MNTTRNEISLLRNKISECLPDTMDIAGYIGIKKSNLLVSLSESYLLFSVLEVYNEKFEFKITERSISQILERANRYLNESWGKSNETEKFDDFVYCISLIKIVVKEAYISLNIEEKLTCEFK
jgi:hypothetical protein